MLLLFFALPLQASTPSSDSQTTLVTSHSNKSSLQMISFESVAVDFGTINAAVAGNPSSDLGIVFIHGTPGSWSAFEGYLTDTELSEQYFLASLDRPGWGKSSLPSDEESDYFKGQSQAVLNFINQQPQEQWIIVGHSLGASIAPKVAFDSHKPGNGSKVRGLLLLAGSLKPTLGKPRWFNRLGNTLLAKLFLNQELERSNQEIMRLSEQLANMEQEILSTQLPINTVLLQGSKDQLVSPRNAEYVQENWIDSFDTVNVIRLAEEGHFLPWRQFDLVKSLIEQLATDLK
ncbi:MAG: alpha/beta fold hydrolase [Pseudomonadota bacterium]